ncbi:MAG: hypothetical protein QOJ00_17 [Actinomycetota bacterium]
MDRRRALLVGAALLFVAALLARTQVDSQSRPIRRTSRSGTTAGSVDIGDAVSLDNTTTSATAPATTATSKPVRTATTRRSVATAAPCGVFPPDNPWNTDISNAPVHANSRNYIASIGVGGHLHPDFGTSYDGAPIGIPFEHVGADQPGVPVSFDYADESDPGPYPIPSDAAVEGGADSTGDRHVIVVDDATCKLYELYDAHRQGAGWHAGSGAVFDLRTNALRHDYWTSADAAGLPIYAGLVRYDEVQAGAINHALRFTVAQTQRGFIHPATHFASNSRDANRPPMGLRLRMLASYSCTSLSRETQVICAALKRFGMIVADNGSNWFVSGQHDPRWNDGALDDLKTVPGSAFDVVDTGPVIH